MKMKGMKEFNKMKTMEDLEQYEKDHPDMDGTTNLKLSIRALTLLGQLIRERKRRPH